jgi:hypothetical protein
MTKRSTPWSARAPSASVARQLLRTTAGSEYRRGRPARAARNLVDSSGSLIRAGQDIPRGAIPTRDIDRLGMHGLVDRRPGDKHIVDSR